MAFSIQKSFLPLLVTVLLAIISSVQATPYPSFLKHSTHRVRHVGRGLKVEVYHPKNTFKVCLYPTPIVLFHTDALWVDRRTARTVHPPPHLSLDLVNHLTSPQCLSSHPLVSILSIWLGSLGIRRAKPSLRTSSSLMYVPLWVIFEIH